MSKRILSIGQCGPDHGSISRLFRQHFDAEVVAAAVESDAVRELQNSSFDLILVNRKLDADYSDGMIIVRRLIDDEALPDVPVMLVSNFAEAQEAAVAVGALYGFGKAELNSPETTDRLKAALEASDAT